ncbi:hypothetical protein Mapa_002803 [Marchantia paleacea]|nr:hypothetical protein Mapa_002803 [Marchantia paleacea]
MCARDEEEQAFAGRQSSGRRSKVSLGQVRLNYSVRDHKARRWRVFSSALRSAGEDIINNPAETSTWIRAYVVA